MKRVNRIWEHPLYREAYARIQELEQDREFCGHSAEHFLAVARLMRIYDLQEGTGLSKETIYAAALLHDIGRHLQYLEGTPHQEASAALAAEILPALRLSGNRDERDSGGHPGPPLSGDPAGKKVSGDICTGADKASRNCLACPAEPACDWPKEKKNLEITD